MEQLSLQFQDTAEFKIHYVLRRNAIHHSAGPFRQTQSCLLLLFARPIFKWAPLFIPPPQPRHLQLAHTISPVFLMEGDRFFPRTATLKNEIPHLRFPQQYNFYPFKSLSLSFLFTFLMFAFYYLPFRSYLHHNHHFISNPLSWQALLYHIEWIL